MNDTEKDLLSDRVRDFIPDRVKNLTSDLKGTEKNNAYVLLGYTVYNIVLLLCYLIEVIKGSRTIGYYIIFSALSLIPLIMMHIMYRRNRADENIKRVLAYGYAFFYTFTVFTTTSPVAFVYGVLIGTFIMSYGEIRLSSISAWAMFAFNVADVIYLGATHQITSDELPNVEIRIGFTLLYAIFMVMGTKVMIKNNQDKLDRIAEEKENIQAMLAQIMNISENMIGNIQVVSDKMGVLENSVSKTKISMEEVSNGTNDTAESVQNQLLMTEEIQNFIGKVENVSGEISSDMDEAGNEVQLGKEKINELIEQVKISDMASTRVSEELEKLTAYAGQMQSIVELIDGITSQTSLLSLNASIEAARVGEAGKGFAVVASEISNLADQTQNATVEITELIENIATELEQVVKVINYMMENNKLQSLAATETASSFETIASRTEDIQRQTDELTDLVGQLANSNEAIVDSIQTISAATEEVTAHSSVTLECSEENSTIVDEVGNLVEQLQSLAQKLSELEQ